MANQETQLAVIDKQRSLSVTNHEKKELPPFINDVQHHHHVLQQEWRVYTMAMNACLGTWFFGYNLGVYNSVQRTIQKLNNWNSDEYDNWTALITASMPCGAFVGAFFAKQVIQWIKGIRKSMLIFDVIAIIGTIIVLIDDKVANLMIGRFICGLSIGINTAVVPVYIKDFSPIEISGKAGAVNQIILTFGVFCSYIISYVLPYYEEIKNETNYNDQGPWRIVLGLPMIAPVIRLIILLFIFRLETPTIMMKQHRYEEVKDFLQHVYSNDDWKEVFHELEEKVLEEEYEHNKKEQQELKSNNKSAHQNELVSNSSQGAVTNVGLALPTNSNELNQLNSEIQETTIKQIHLKSELDFYHEKIFELSNKATYWKRFIVACIIQFAVQCSGVNAILFYSNQIFKKTAGGTGLEADKTARAATAGLGASMVVFNFISFVVLGKFGRRTLMLFGVTIVLISLYVFAGVSDAEQTKAIQNFGIFLIFLFQFGWQLSLGAVTWVVNSETTDRFGISVSCFIRWFFAMVVGLVFPYMEKSIELLGAFLVFAGFTTPCYLYLIYQLKETKGKDRYQILESYCSKKQYQQFNLQAKEYAQQQYEYQQKALIEQKKL